MHPAATGLILGGATRPARGRTLATEPGEPARKKRPCGLIEMANGWTAFKTRKGGTGAVHESGRKVYGKRAQQVLREGTPQRSEREERIVRHGPTEDEARQFDDTIRRSSFKELHGLGERLAQTDGKVLGALAKHFGVAATGGRKATAARVHKAILARKVGHHAEGRRAMEERIRTAPKELARKMAQDLEREDDEDVERIAATLGVTPHRDPQRTRAALISRVKQLRRQPRAKKPAAESERSAAAEKKVGIDRADLEAQVRRRSEGGPRKAAVPRPDSEPDPLDRVAGTMRRARPAAERRREAPPARKVPRQVEPRQVEPGDYDDMLEPTGRAAARARGQRNRARDAGRAKMRKR